MPEIVKAMNQRQELRKVRCGGEQQFGGSRLHVRGICCTVGPQIRQQHFPEEKTEWASLQQRHNEYAAVRLMLEEPSLIREVIPPPKSTPSARVQTAVASVQSAISQVSRSLAGLMTGPHYLPLLLHASQAPDGVVLIDKWCATWELTQGQNPSPAAGEFPIS